MGGIRRFPPPLPLVAIATSPSFSFTDLFTENFSFSFPSTSLPSPIISGSVHHRPSFPSSFDHSMFLSPFRPCQRSPHPLTSFILLQTCPTGSSSSSSNLVSAVYAGHVDVNHDFDHPKPHYQFVGCLDLEVVSAFPP